MKVMRPSLLQPMLRSVTSNTLHIQSKTLSSLPLEGVKVVDMTRVLAAPYATMNLSDLGADVIKVERPGIGDETRKWGPPFLSPTLSNYFACCNRNKRSIVVDYTTHDGQVIIKKLMAQSDVFVENLKPGTLKKYKLDYENIKSSNEELIFASLSGYGQDGPYSKQGAYDVPLSAEGGLMGITGPVDGEPVKVGVALTDICSGLYLYSSIVAALYHRTKTGLGQQIDVSMFSTQLSMLVNVASNYLNSGIIAKPLGSSHLSIVPYQAFKTSDAYVVIAANNDSQFYDLSEAVGWPWLPSNPMFSTNELRVENSEELLKHLTERFAEETTEYWVDIASSFSFTAAPINNIQEAFEHPQAIHSDIVKTVHNEVDDVDIKVVGHPVKFNGKDPNNYTAPPVLGQHTISILQDLGYSDEEIRVLQKKNIIQSAT
ncbi:succinate--hydroxymethylglutarate CoA-transferase-like [Bolinopsis microptera]|uniref:succinate--hydroxymethylglutarate CoA-transferase-like n=1 Tax=Bolinopsis microptera TaxID=2820187 RepID=UPI003078D2B4